MPDQLLLPVQPPTPDRPLAGLTVLAVEDSRYASEALRLMCLRSGARLRRAEDLAAAGRHLACWRPGVVLVDIGLPDGSGCALISQLARARRNVPVLLGMSGEDRADEARAAGADGFLSKPIRSIVEFQRAILNHLLRGDAARATRGNDAAPAARGNGGDVARDPLALRDDLRRAAELIDAAPGPEMRTYLGRFLGGIAIETGDTRLAAAARALTDGPSADAPSPPAAGSPAALTDLRRIVGRRIDAVPGL